MNIKVFGLIVVPIGLPHDQPERIPFSLIIIGAVFLDRDHRRHRLTLVTISIAVSTAQQALQIIDFDKAIGTDYFQGSASPLTPAAAKDQLKSPCNHDSLPRVVILFIPARKGKGSQTHLLHIVKTDLDRFRNPGAADRQMRCIIIATPIIAALISATFTTTAFTAAFIITVAGSVLNALICRD